MNSRAAACAAAFEAKLRRVERLDDACAGAVDDEALALAQDDVAAGRPAA